jgi:hypothetical protein
VLHIRQQRIPPNIGTGTKRHLGAKMGLTLVRHAPHGGTLALGRRVPCHQTGTSIGSCIFQYDTSCAHICSSFC